MTATCDGARDKAGNAGARKSVTYTVSAPTFPFTGFFAPVDLPPILNAMNAGAAVPVKFSLGGDRGLKILAPGSPSSGAVSCSSGAAIAPVEQTVTAGNSGLSYDAASKRYTYVWKTDKAWAGTCRRLEVKLTDGTSHPALFRFTK